MSKDNVCVGVGGVRRCFNVVILLFKFRMSNSEITFLSACSLARMFNVWATTDGVVKNIFYCFLMRGRAVREVLLNFEPSKKT